MRRKLEAIRLKLPSSSSSDEKSTIANSSTFATLRLSLNIFKEVAGKCGVPGLQEGVKALVILLDTLQKISINAGDVESLTKRVEDLTATLGRAMSEGALSTSMRDRIDRLAETWISTVEKVRLIASHSYISRFVNSENDARAIAGHVSSISFSIQSFTIESLISIELAVEAQGGYIQDATNRIVGKIDNVSKAIAVMQVNFDMNGDLKIPRAVKARFECSDREPCFAGTRADILDKIYNWIDLGDSPALSSNTITDKTESARIFWLNGPGSGGNGKSTIAHTVAQRCKDQDILAGSFFCSRDEDACSNPRLIFTTLAYHLSLYHAQFKIELMNILKSDPDKVYTGVSHQLETLLVKPLIAVRDSFPFGVVVIDALDECKDDHTVSVVLTALAHHIDNLSPIKFLITSRPEQNIVGGFKLEKLSAVTQNLILHKVNSNAVNKDIHDYLAFHLNQIRDDYGLLDWPTKENVLDLTQLSAGLFLFAATATKFIGDQKYSNPQHQLAYILESKPLDGASLNNLDKLYTQVLHNAFPDISMSLARTLRTILGVIVLLQDPLSPFDLQQLLGRLNISVRNILRHLHSVVIVPENDDDVIRLIHPSFYHFLTDPTRCLDPKFLVHADIQHTMLAQACLNVMESLTPDICHIGSCYKLNKEINMPELLSASVPSNLQYACRHWAYHLSCGHLSDSIIELLEKFCMKYMLCWMEVCGLQGELKEALVALHNTHRLLSKCGKNQPKLLDLLHDCERFARKFFPVLNAATSQIYSSVLPFAPSESSLQAFYKGQVKGFIKVLNGVEEDWDPCLQTIECHSDSVNSVACSPNGFCIATASSDHTAQLWDAASGLHLKTLKGHSGWVNSVAFSVNGEYILSGSSDMTIKLWDSVTGENLKTFKDHKNEVTSVAFSPSGDYAVSGSADQTVKVWRLHDAWGPACVTSCDGHRHSVLAVAFSPDGSSILSGSADKTICLWDSTTGNQNKKFHGHSGTVNSVAFSLDGICAVSGSSDKTIRVWSISTASQLRKINGHADSISTVIFSNNGSQIVSGSFDKTIKIWDTSTGNHLQTLEGHQGQVKCLAFFKDDSHIISASIDLTVKLWDAVIPSHVIQKGDHAAHINSVRISPNGVYIASATNNDTVQIWDAKTGNHLRTFLGHTGPVFSAAFSPDSTKVVSASADHTVQVWNVATGALVKTLIGHTAKVYTAAFSFSGTLIVSGSLDKTVKLWEASTGALLKTLEGHSKAVTSVVFSPSDTSVGSGGADHTVQVWNTDSGKQICILNGHSKEVLSIVFSATGTILASASLDQTIQIWDPITGNQIKCLNVGHHVNRFGEIYFSSDQKSILTSFGKFDIGIDLGPGNKSIISSKVALPSYYAEEDGWIFSAATQKQICWIPHECRGYLTSNENTIVLGSSAGNMTILDLKDMNSHLRSL